MLAQLAALPSGVRVGSYPGTHLRSEKIMCLRTGVTIVRKICACVRHSIKRRLGGNLPIQRISVIHMRDLIQIAVIWEWGLTRTPWGLWVNHS